MKSPSRNTKILTGILSLLALILLLAVTGRFFNNKVKPGSQPTQISQRKVKEWHTMESTILPITETVVGTVQSRETVVLRTRISATVKKIYAVPGKEVKRGKVLIELDKRDIMARIGQTEHQLEDAKANLSKAQNDFQRIEKLFNEKVVSNEHFDRIQADLKTAKARVRQVDEILNEVKANLSYTTIKAPLDGRIVDKFIEAGDLASPGKPLLEIYNPISLRLEATVRESLIQKLQIGKEYTVHLETIGKKVAGTLEEILPAINPGSRSLRIRVSLPETPGLLTGMFGRLELPIGFAERLLVPSDAVETIGQLQFVTVQDMGTTIRRSVKLSKRQSNDYQVIAGLNSGETVALFK